MNPMTEFFGRCFDFKGRTGRKAFWVAGATMAAPTLILLGVAAAFWGSDLESSPISLAALILFIPWLALSIRRLHDVNRSGWWQLLVLTGFGTVVLIYWHLTPGTAGPNRFGLGRLQKPESLSDSPRLHQTPAITPGQGAGKAQAVPPMRPAAPPSINALTVALAITAAGLLIVLIGVLAYSVGEHESPATPVMATAAPALRPGAPPANPGLSGVGAQGSEADAADDRPDKPNDPEAKAYTIPDGSIECLVNPGEVLCLRKADDMLGRCADGECEKASTPDSADIQLLQNLHGASVLQEGQSFSAGDILCREHSNGVECYQNTVCQNFSLFSGDEPADNLDMLRRSDENIGALRC